MASTLTTDPPPWVDFGTRLEQKIGSNLYINIIPSYFLTQVHMADNIYLSFPETLR